MHPALLMFFFWIAFSCSDKDEAGPIKVESCTHTVYSGANNCDAGYVAVPGGCCPSTNPWYCNGTCYLYCSDAAKNCGSGVIKGNL